ncbi:MAG TPA: adenylate/guanylate cyclase domain-containing protein [Anaerolineaceae bacterium]
MDRYPLKKSTHPNAGDLVDPLTRREQEILALLAQDRTNAEIAQSLSLALSSVKWYAQQIYAKLGVKNRQQAVSRARELGLLEGARPPAAEASGLPSGTVCFLFTDIEGSTPLWEQMPEVMQAAVAQHHTILRQSIEAHGGQVFQVIGDAFQAAFRLTSEGLCAALAAQRGLRDAHWGPSGPLKVRMGLHTGPAELSDGKDAAYQVGHTLNRTARVMSAGHGGQVLLSQEAADLVERELPAGVSLLDLGQHHLKGMQRLEHLYQVVAEDLPHHFPPLASGVSYPHNLPVQLTSFIGREKEVAALEELFLARKARLVTLTGSGGTGKTRLALKTAETLLELFPHGIWLVELAPIADPELVPRAVAEVLGMHDEPQSSISQVLARYLRPRQTLLILDNCEHVVGAASALAGMLLQACPQLHILATSREILGVAGEVPFHCPSLSLPKGKTTIDDLAGSEAVQLFVQRAQTSEPGFSLTESNAPVIARICQRLDGIPLALELAAARTRMLSVEQIAARLDQVFRLLTGGARSVLPRHQTLKALIDWSYNLLSDEERALLLRLSVFAGGWTLEAAEEVCADRNSGGKSAASAAEEVYADRRDGGKSAEEVCADPTGLIVPEQILDLMGQLLDKSLVQIEGPDESEPPHSGEGPHSGEAPHYHEARYRMLETVRQYARERSVEGGDVETLRERHLDYYLALALRAEPHLRGPDASYWLDLLDRELDNFRLALEWSLGGSVVKGLAMVAALRWLWHTRDHRAEGVEWLDKLLASDESQSQAQPRDAAAWVARGRALYIWNALAITDLLGDPVQTRQRGLESRAIFQKLNDETGGGFQLDLARASYSMMVSLEDGLAVRQAFLKLGDRFSLAETAMFLSAIQIGNNDLDSAERFVDENLALRRELGDADGEGFAYFLSSVIATMRGRYDQAVELAQRSLSTMKQVDNKYAEEFPRAIIRMALMAQGEYQQVIERVEIDRAFGKELNSQVLLIDADSYAGYVAWALQDYDRAVQIANKVLEMCRGFPYNWRKMALYVLGRVALSQGNFSQAREYLLDARVKTVVTETFHDYLAVHALGVLAAAQQQYRRAAVLFGAQAGPGSATLNLMCPAERESQAQAVAAARAALGEDAFNEAWEYGKSMSDAEARSYTEGSA